MKKTWWVIFTLICLIVFTLFIFQWDDFKSNSNEGNKHDVVQVIELIHQSDVIKVNQTIEELQNKTYQLTFPERGANFVCFNETGTEACSANYEVKNNQIKVEYEIPTDSKQNAFLLDHWLPQIEDVEISETIVNISEEKKGSYWAAGASLIYFEQFENLDFFVFENSEANFALFWQSTPLTYTEQDEIVPIYYESGNLTNMSFQKFKFEENSRFTYPAIVLTNQYEPYITDKLIIASPDKAAEQIYKMWVKQFIMQNIWLDNGENAWVSEVLASLETGVTPTEEVALKIYQELKTKLSEEEIDTFIQSVYERKQPIQSLKELDYLLGDIKGLQTDFFENNSTSFTELYFYLEKPIVINELEIADQLVYYSFDHYYLPLKLVVEQYGYSYKQISNDELYITNRTDTYRFYRNKQIFLFNEEEYGLLTDESFVPFLKIHQDIYIQDEFLEEIFELKIYHLEHEILLKKI